MRRLRLTALVLVLATTAVVGGPAQARTAGEGERRAPATGWAVVDAGDQHTCGLLTDGRAYCWGANFYGQLGTGDQVSSTTPVPVAGSRRWRTISVGSLSTCGLTRLGKLLCWGYGGRGALGLGPVPEDVVLTPRAVGSRDWRSVSVGRNHACATTTTGTLSCWGTNDVGQVGDGTLTTRWRPVRLGRAGDWVRADVWSATSCATDRRRRLFCWGQGDPGAVGDGASGDRRTPSPIGAPGWGSVSVGYWHVCGVRRSSDAAAGTAWCWGADNWHQRAADGSRALAPEQVGRSGSWRSVEAGVTSSCGVRGSGRLLCWGDNSYGQLGTGDTTARPRPSAETTASTWASVDVGGQYACAIKEASRRLFCWGYGGTGALGLGDLDSTSTPRRVDASR